jgi:hypothetical protein
MIRRCSALIVVSVLFLTVGSATSSAQSPPVTTTVTADTLSELLPSLYIESLIDSINAFEGVFGGSDLISLRNQLDSAFQINDLLGQQLSSFPLGSSAGGFTWTFDPAMGTYNRASITFGPTFAERALTIGRNRFNLGVNFQRATFDQIEGKNLDGEEIKIYTGLRGVFFEDSLDMKVSTNTLGIFANYGVTDRIDIGAAVPIVSMHLTGERVNVYRGQTLIQANATAITSGVADVAITARAHLLGGRASGLAAGTEIRLPTGREEDLLGSGELAMRVLAIASFEGTHAAAHVNGGYWFGGISREGSYSAAVTVAASSRVTLVGEFLGRWIEGLGEIGEVSAPHPRSVGVDTIRLLPIDTESRTMTGMAVAGIKWNVGDRWLVNGNLLMPVTNRGLRARVVPAIGLDYSFGR